MKKSLAILIMFSYMLCASGLCISFHYCGGSFKYVTLTPDIEDKGCCGTKKKDRCCKDKTVKFSQDDHHKTISKLSTVPPDFSKALTQTPDYSFSDNHCEYLTVTAFHLRPPPLQSGGPPLYILHSVFRI